MRLVVRPGAGGAPHEQRDHGGAEEGADAARGDRVDEHVAAEGSDEAHPARSGGTAGQRGEDGEAEAGDQPAAAPGEGDLVPGQRPRAERPVGRDRGDERRQQHQATHPRGGRADRGQRGEQRDDRERAEHDRAGRDERGAADGEAGPEEEGAGEERRVGDERGVDEGVEAGLGRARVEARGHRRRVAQRHRERHQEREGRHDQQGAEHRSGDGSAGAHGHRHEGRPDGGPPRPDGDRGRRDEGGQHDGPGQDARHRRVHRGAGGERGDHHGHHGVAGEERHDRDRHREVALAVGDPVGVGAVPGDGVADPVADPPHRPHGHRGHAQRHDRDACAHHGEAGPVARQPGEGAHPHAVAGRAVHAGVGDEPADHPHREQHDERGEGGRGTAEGRDQHERPRAGSVGPGGVGTGEERRHGRSIITRCPPPTALPRRPRTMCAPCATPVPWTGHEEPRDLRRLLRRDTHAPAARGVRPHRRRPGRPGRRAGRLRGHVAPLAQGRAPRRPRRLHPPDRLPPGPAPAHRPDLAPRQVPGPRGPHHPRRAVQAHPAPARAPRAQRACPPSRSPTSGAWSACRAPTPSASCRRPRRSSRSPATSPRRTYAAS